MQKKLSHQSGMTLLELIIATAIVSVISTISYSSYNGYIETTKVSQAVSQIRALTLLIDDYDLEYGEHPQSLSDIGNEGLLDPWGKPYSYLSLTRENDDDEDDNHSDDKDKHDEHDEEEDEDDDKINIGAARKDGNLVPINTKYDLCSHGKDGESKPPLRAKVSHDDIIYANDGAYIGLASEF